MTDGPTCSLCGYAPPADADNPVNSVIAHISSSKGEHEGIGYQQARSMVDGEPDEPVDDPAGITDDSTDADAGDDGDTGGDGGLGLSGNDPFQGAPDTDDSADPDPGSMDDGSMDADDSPSPDSDGSISAGIGVIGALAAVAVAVLSLRQQNRQTDDQQNDGPDLV
ncbi:hypothetical protein [Halosimplex marinum]|uniref:hypothetical protein n=1 Tax=Halosimplex marinum TaxID=3396620 RepID=UPI003F57D2B9